MLHQIGIGTLGPVFRTYEPTRDRLVAVKVFRLDIIPEQAQVLADALGRAIDSSLAHPSIVEPIAAGLEGTLAYRAEEYVAAESLDVAMRHYAPASIEKALPFITQLAGAIDFARAAGVGHGGLHPRDIFVTPDEARATGFGVVEALEEVGIRAPIRRPYSAPERIAGSEWSTPADVFALAAITFELLTARRPAGTGAQIGALPDGERTALLHAVLARAMDDDPSRRYATALAFAGALESASRGETPMAQSAVPAAALAGAVALGSAGLAATVGGDTETEDDEEDDGQGDGESDFEIEIERDVAADAEDVTGLAAERQSDAAPAAATPTLFDNDDREADDVLGEISADEREPERFAEDFVDDPEPSFALPMESAEHGAAGAAFADAVEPERVAVGAPASGREPEPASAGDESVYAAKAGMFAADSRRPEPDSYDVPERSGPMLLQQAVTAVLMLLVGFAAGYFVGSRDRVPSGADTAPAAVAQPATRVPSGPATPQTPGQYSEQQVTPPAATASVPTASAPTASAPKASAPKASAPNPAPRLREPAPSAPASTASAPTASAPKASAPNPAPAASPRPTERTATTGRMVIRSTPSRANVTLNGRWRGRTPLTLDDLPFGRYVVRVVADGFRVAREEVTLNTRNASQTINTRLTRNARASAPVPAAPAPRPGSAPAAPDRGAAEPGFTGSLYVDSRPRGATVLLDGRNVGQTPLSLPDVAIGSHVVRIEMAGKRPWSTTTRVVAGQMERVTGSLEDQR